MNGFYSALHQSITAAKGAPRSGTAQAWAEWLDGAQRRGEFRRAERDWLGVDAWLESREGAIEREAVQRFIRSNQLKMEVVTKGTPSLGDFDLPEGWSLRRDPDDLWRVRARGVVAGSGMTIADAARAAGVPLKIPNPGSTQYAKYTLLGGGEYRELLIVLPRPESPAEVTISESVQAEHQAEIDALARRREAALGRPEYGKVMWDEAQLTARMRLQTLQEMGGLKPTFTGGHFREGNVLAHLRFDERFDSEGRRLLLLQEIQSDWHQLGRREGYGATSGLFHVLAGEDGAELSGPHGSWAEADYSAAMLREQGVSAFVDPPSRGTAPHVVADGGVPDAPFKPTAEWTVLAFKHAMRVAVQSGCAAIAWVPGEVHAERYDMSHEIAGIHWSRNLGTGLYQIEAPRVGRGEPLYKRGLDAGALEKLVGKELAKKIMDGVGRNTDDHAAAVVDRGFLTQADLKLGGEGLRAFYDDLLPKAVARYTKPLGGQVEHAAIEVPQRGKMRRVEVQCVPITDRMREAVASGLPLFRLPAASTAPSVGMAVETVASIARQFLDGYAGGLSGLAVRVGRTMEDLYGPGASEIIGATAAGAYHPARGLLTVAANRMRDRSCVEATLRHELLGHFGLNTFLPEDKRAILDTILASRDAPGMRGIWEAVDRRYADRDQDTRAEEVFALIAEQPRGHGAQLFDAVMALVNKALRAVRLTTGETSRAELRVLAQAIARGLREGHRQQQNFPESDHALFRRPNDPNVAFLMARTAEQRMARMSDAEHAAEEAGVDLHP
ncbi:MAG: hypothetical protein EPN79_16110 [Burkholderiaceae bacterium]|nr:MAG: hypothetical protein EPN79_16110 [Burkholderiaceae bacterium]